MTCIYWKLEQMPGGWEKGFCELETLHPTFNALTDCPAGKICELHDAGGVDVGSVPGEAVVRFPRGYKP